MTIYDFALLINALAHVLNALEILLTIPRFKR
jgi:hypothetical protein